MLDPETLRVLQSLTGNLEWIYPARTSRGTEWVYRVDGQLRGFWQLPVAFNVLLRSLSYEEALRWAGRIEVESQERGETPVNLLSEAERQTLGLLLRGN